MYGEKIRYFRKLKGLSQAEMANLLNIEQASYSKIETNRTRLATDILEKIAEILDVSPMAIIKDDQVIVNFNEGANNNGTVNSWVNAETVFNYQKDLMERLISSKDNEISSLKSTIETLNSLLTANKPK